MADFKSFQGIFNRNSMRVKAPWIARAEFDPHQISRRYSTAQQKKHKFDDFKQVTCDHLAKSTSNCLKEIQNFCTVKLSKLSKLLDPAFQVQVSHMEHPRFCRSQRHSRAKEDEILVFYDEASGIYNVLSLIIIIIITINITITITITIEKCKF